MDIEPQHHPPVPSLPADAAVASASHGPRSRRRSSLPSSAPAEQDAKKRAPNHIRLQPASPEVISSLIDSLSAISLPAHNHFENLPTVPGAVSSPASPNLQTKFTPDTLAVPQHGNGLEYNAYRQSLRDGDHLYPDDACEPPVVRTSKPPSGLSPLTAPKKKDKDNSLKSYIARGSESLTSLHSTRSLRSVSSIGNISIEAGVPRKPSNGSTRSSDESKRSSRGHRGLMYMSSRERLRLKDAERRRASIQGPEVAAPPEVKRKPLPPQLLVSEDTIKEEPAVAESSSAPRRNQSAPASPLRNGLGPPTTIESPSEKGLIPERGSSLRHSGSPTRRGRKGQGRKSTRHDSYKTNTVPEEDEHVDEEMTEKEKILKELEAEENEVAHRIRELRKQKLLRDKIAGKLPVGADAGASPGASSVSPVATSASSESTPTSTVSTVLEKRAQNPAKAHKVLGIEMPEAPTERQMPPAPESPSRETQRTLGHARHRSLTVNDGDDVTPLPINYPFVLENLPGETIATPPSPSATSSPSTAHSTPPTRSKSLAVGGRSAAARKTTTSMIVGTPTTGHKYSTSITRGDLGERPYLRSASEEITARLEPIDMTASPSSGVVQRRPTLKKNRWSHPDLPVKAETRRNEKVDSMHAAVQLPTHSVAEERPSSVDSVDVDVEKFLDSPRLSQRIRHPQSGRVISFSEVGDPQGFAIFVCVGMGLTRYVTAFYDQLALTLRLRLITPDRPGIGGSQVDPNGTPLSWPDDVLVICQALKITKFSLLAHSAGAVYALATALRMPQHIRGRVHLLAPWIPPSQMAPIGNYQDQPPTQQLPRSQRFLRALPPSLLKVANSSFLSATSASLQRTTPKNSPKTKRKSMNVQPVQQQQQQQRQLHRPPIKETRRESIMLMDQVLPSASSLSLAASNPADPNYERARSMKEALTIAERERQHAFDERLTFSIWDRATTNAHPATDLIVCLETKQSIGFRYEDITRGVVIHHGSKDTRVPVENVRWLGRLMRRCEVRILEGEQHGLMASALVMGNVLTEMAKEWEDWTAVVQGKATNNHERSTSRRRETDSVRSRH